ncbi:hypothetical protein [Rudanella lutea]|uniref:hypothetical protein n=1 Tax=Rudanella lutea TaxID=451374 RepID=UPI0003A80413|nr:hypothetical protein [Rudanella lutea]
MSQLNRQPAFGALPLVGLLLVLSAIACREYGENHARQIEEERSNPPAYRVVTIEGCEYLRMEVTHGYAVLTHKGNCRNPIHCRMDTVSRPDRTEGIPGR